MKEIIYGKDMNHLYVADEGEYMGVKYFIVAGGFHPCAYVMCDKDFVEKHYDKEWDTIYCIDVHGGITWCEDISHLKTHPKEYEGMCFGWDYGHAGDYAGYCPDGGGSKWTLKEIQEDVQDAIKQYIKVQHQDLIENS